MEPNMNLHSWQQIGSIALLLVLSSSLAGCTQSTPGDEPVAPGPITPEVAPASSAHVFPDSSQWLGRAQERAALWHDDAALALIATFEGAVPQFSSPLFGPQRWATATGGPADEPLDGHSHSWAYSFVVPDAVYDVGQTLCDLNQHTELVEMLVVIIDENGTVLDEYTTRNDDEGAPPVGLLTGAMFDSAQAAKAARHATSLSRQASEAVWGQTFLLAEWYWEQPAWVFIAHTEERRHMVAVDAETGRVLHDGPPLGARC